ncbi:MAG TPA: hypothetical protein PK040_02020, partial [Anaerolineaceae bacterium]|nr:hypothetical protein [Anaerolineaceae bacterium]
TDKNANTEIRKEFCPNCEAETPCTHEAELYVCDICGEDFAKYIVSRNCNVSDVSMTQDVLTDIKKCQSIENTNPDYYKDELSRIIDDNAKFQEMATAKMTKLQSEIDRLKLVTDEFYLLLVDNPDTKLLADAILCEVYGIETLEEK